MARNFAALVERVRPGQGFGGQVDRGIRTSALAAAVRDRGFTAFEVSGTPERLQAEIDAGRPVIALIQDRPGTFHYVVVVGSHARAVVLHDPAKAPFRVATRGDFDRRWKAARAWALVIAGPERVEMELADRLHAPSPGSDPFAVPLTGSDPPLNCEARVAEGVQLAGQGNLDAAERTLAAAVYACPGATPRRELAGVRLLQRRWSEVRDLASESLRIEPHDEHATRLLATSLFVEDDVERALDVWNTIGEPRIDLVSIDGLSRTRHRVVERLLDLEPSAMLTADGMARSARRLEELPAALSTRLEYVPVPNGRTEVRATVAERSLIPRGLITFTVLGLQAAASREAILDLANTTGGGEQVTARWRFWPARPRYSLAMAAPAPWGGLWQVEGFAEHQAVDSSAGKPEADRTGARLGFSDWATGAVKWEAQIGLDRWKELGAAGAGGGSLSFRSLPDTVRIVGTLNGWVGHARFASARLSGAWRSSSGRRGTMLLGRAAVEAITAAAPVDLWPAGDTGHARDALLRAHPVLEGGRLRLDRLGRLFSGASLEVQRWISPPGPIAIGLAGFVDLGTTAYRPAGTALHDTDLGAGIRVVFPGTSGVLRLDGGHGLRDRRTAVSVAWLRNWSSP